jgi:hypothetical protein
MEFDGSAIYSEIKPSWKPMLEALAALHRACTHPAGELIRLPHPWEEIGSGYCYAPAFGHWDIVHQMLDQLSYDPQHVRHQLVNNWVHQLPNGFLPGTIYSSNGETVWNTEGGHPPVWPVALEEYWMRYGGKAEESVLREGYDVLLKQIEWFEHNRKAEPEGCYYTDIYKKIWESGVDDGLRFEHTPTGPFACVDATSHMFLVYEHAASWAERLGKTDEAERLHSRARQLEVYIQYAMFDEETGFFHDSWSVGLPALRRLTIEGIWPIVVGAAAEHQAMQVIDGNLLHPGRFFTRHPLPSVAVSEPAFELRMWRGPTWNSMTYWAAKGCMRYGRLDAASVLLERALDGSAEQFSRTNTVWEFYHPHGGDPLELARKPYTPYNAPCRDYLGHNPLRAMAELWVRCRLHDG